jgi:pSer/pThr/pTyr-binding forkhead associated (FHA) protein
VGVGLALVEQALRRSWVQVLSGRQEGRSYLLGRGKSTVGLDERATVGLFGDPTIARSHAEIEGGAEGFILRNLDPQGRTKRNGNATSGSEALNDGDIIELGNTRLVFRNRG